MDREAFERARSAYGTGAYDDATLEFIFPQLKESEDEKIIKTLQEYVKNRNWSLNGPTQDEVLEWLEKQKEQKPWKVGANAYFTPEQNPVEWSDTNELVFKDICKHLKEEGYNGWVVLLNALRNGEFQSKQEWSEEDEEMLEEIINHIDTTSVQRIPARPGSAIGKSWIKFLKSLRPSWRPSEEDIKMLEHIIGQYETGNKNSKVMGYLPRVEELSFLKNVLSKWKN